MEEKFKVNLIVGKDGRITIPLKIRDVLGLEQGDVITIHVDVLTGLTILEKIEN